ncbi:MAG: EamA family transporter, partial [bacterium]|nr:EamA family transporter [bacterium]
MIWIWLALLAPLLWAGSNIFDKYALEKVTRGVYDFLFFGTVGTFFIALLAFAVFGLGEIGRAALVPVAGGFLLQFSYLFYSHALAREDASYIAPLYITYSVVVLIVGFFFGETLTPVQILAFFIMFFGAMILSLRELSFEIFHYRTAALLMLPAILLISLYVVFINYSLDVLSFTDTFIYDAVGFSLAGLSLMLVPAWRGEIVKGIKKASLRKLGLFLFNDTLDVSGHLVFKYALLLAPSAGLVAVLGGIQPFYVLVLGVLFTLFLPRIISEKITRKEITQKIAGTIII